MTALTLLGLTLSSAHSDEILLTSGGTIEGTIESESAEQVVIVSRGNNRLTVPRSQIIEIQRLSEEENTLLRARMAIAESDLESMIEALDDAQGLGVSPETVAWPLLSTPTALVTLVSNTSPIEGEQTRTFILDVLSQVDSTNEVLYLTGRICQVTDEKSRAIEAFEQIDHTWWMENPDSCGEVSMLYFELAREAMDARDHRAALSALTQMTVVDPVAASEVGPIFLIQMANAEAEGGNWNEALRIIEEEVAPQVPEIAHLYLESLFLEMEKRPQTGAELAPAVDAFTAYAPRHLPETANERLIEMNLRLGELLLEEKDFAGARSAFNRHYDLADPDVFLRKRVLAATILEEIDQLEPDDWDNRIRLVVELIDSEILEEALTQCIALGRAPDVRIRRFAAQNRHAIQLRLGREQFDLALLRYDEGDFAGALDLIVEEAEVFYDAQLIEEVNALRRICEMRLSEVPNQEALRAMNLYQQAERHFFHSQYDEAVAILEPMIRQYPDTQAAEQGRAMLNTANQFRMARQPERADIREATPTPVTSEATLQDATLQELEEMFQALEELHPDS